MTNIRLTDEFKLAYRFATETNLNIFLTGKAGTGKTTFLKYLRENAFKNMVVASPTGVAAINAGGVTLHSLFQLPFAPYIPSKENNLDGVNSHSLLSQIRYNSEKLNLFRNLELLVIDEVSMVASHTVDAIDVILKSVRRKHYLPFGGVQVLFIGDLYQLPPVVKNQEWELLRNYYPSPFFFDSIVLRAHVPVMIELKEIFRQQDNEFIEVLNEIRNNDLSSRNFELLNSRLKRNFTPGDDEGYITLTTHNSQSDEINSKKLGSIAAVSKIYDAEINGSFPEHMYPAAVKLELKEGAQVMFLKNDNEERKYFNGKIGVITKLGIDQIKVKCKGEDLEIDVKKHEWKNVNYSVNGETHEIKEEELGGFVQYPLRLAWAITIHKSQGLTFDKLIVDAENAFANGQVYVALSRCTSLQGLVLTSPINQRFLGAQQNLHEWQCRNYDERGLPRKFNESRRKYISRELQHIFTWANWMEALEKLDGLLVENLKEGNKETSQWINNLADQAKKLQEVADKFKRKISELSSKGIEELDEVEDNPALQVRIKDAANYFTAELMKWKQAFNDHPISLDTRKAARKIDLELGEINIIVHKILGKLENCKNGFLLTEYLKNTRIRSEAPGQMKSAYAETKLRGADLNDLEHAELYKRISLFRNGIAQKLGIAVYLVFNNSAIKNVCLALPGTKEALSKISGFKKAKIDKYGDEILQIVLDYCDEKDIQPKEANNEVVVKEKKTPTVDETVRIFKLGKTLEEIAKERNLAVSTIESHLAQAIQQNRIHIEQFMSMDEVHKIAAYFPSDIENIQLSPIKEILPEISFGKLKMVLSWLQKTKNVSQQL